MRGHACVPQSYQHQRPRWTLRGLSAALLSNLPHNQGVVGLDPTAAWAFEIQSFGVVLINAYGLWGDAPTHHHIALWTLRNASITSHWTSLSPHTLHIIIDGAVAVVQLGSPHTLFTTSSQVVAANSRTLKHKTLSGGCDTLCTKLQIPRTQPLTVTYA